VDVDRGSDIVVSAHVSEFSLPGDWDRIPSLRVDLPQPVTNGRNHALSGETWPRVQAGQALFLKMDAALDSSEFCLLFTDALHLLQIFFSNLKPEGTN
jgi:hypothetical protein